MTLLTTPLDGLVASRPKLAVLRALHHRTEAVSARELARQTGFSHPTMLHALDDLVAQGAVLQTDAGRQRLCRLNTRHELVRSILPKLFDAEWRWTDRLLALLREALSRASDTAKGDGIAAYIYGSVARGEDAPASDLDLLVLVRDRARASRVRAALADIAGFLHTHFGVRIAPVILPLREARRRAARGDPFLTAAAADARTVVGDRDLTEVLRGPAHQ